MVIPQPCNPAPKKLNGRQVVVYTAGPYRDQRGPFYVEQNIRAAESVAIRLWALGYAVVCPHMNTKHFDGVCPANVWLEGDQEILSRCDVCLMLPRWVESVGAKDEMAYAVNRGVPVVMGVQELESWYAQRSAEKLEDFLPKTVGALPERGREKAA